MARVGDPPLPLEPPDRDDAREALEQIAQAARDADRADLAARLGKAGRLTDFLGAVFAHSPYLRTIAELNPDLLDETLNAPFDAAARRIVDHTRVLGTSAASEAELMKALRRAKKHIALTCALADLGRWWDAAASARALSDFADASLSAGLDFLLRQAAARGHIELDDDADPQAGSGIIVLAMGKHGARELNYSSDIDIVVFHDEPTAMRLDTDDPTTLITRWIKQLIRILQERTGDGYVFRVDPRLRPDPASTPLAIPVAAGLVYYESQGQNWERAALIKARAAAGDIAAGERMLEELAPFIWRKHLDYAAIADVHSIKRQIHSHKGHGVIATAGHNVKLGRGGIREIEFFVQTQQLIAGGRVPALRTRRTDETLDVLCREGWIDRAVVEELTEAYWYLRDVEHRLQMVGDEQTHTLPEDDEGMRRIALMMGAAGQAEFAAGLTKRLETVQRHYAGLFEAAPALAGEMGNLVFTGEEPDPDTVETLAAMGYERAGDIVRTVRGWHFGRYPALRTATAREMLTEIAPSLLAEIAATGRPDETLVAFDRFIAGLPAGIPIFSLIKSNPHLARLLMLLLGAAPRMAAQITRAPHVFDGLLDPAFAATIPDRAALADWLNAYLSKVRAYEQALDRARVFAAEQKFLIGVRLITGTIDARQAGHAFSALAEVLIDAMVAQVTAEFARRHGHVPGGRIAVLGMGRLGARELTAGSDLDLIFLYDHPEDAEASDGPKPLATSQYFIRLTQRLIAAMSAPTAEGVIYELDFRLRPSGKAGPLATHIAAFSNYQRHQAWTWEHQALTRARAVAGDAELCAAAEREIADILGERADRAKLAADIVDMRKTIDREKGSDNPWNCKDVRGGLIDIEFIAQWLVLCGALGDGERAVGTREVLHAAPHDRLPAADRETLLAAFDLFNTVLQTLRACLDEDFIADEAPPGLAELVALRTDFPELGAAQARLREMQAQVRDIFIRTLG